MKFSARSRSAGAQDAHLVPDATSRAHRFARALCLALAALHNARRRAISVAWSGGRKRRPTAAAARHVSSPRSLGRPVETLGTHAFTATLLGTAARARAGACSVDRGRQDGQRRAAGRASRLGLALLRCRGRFARRRFRRVHTKSRDLWVVYTLGSEAVRVEGREKENMPDPAGGLRRATGDKVGQASSGEKDLRSISLDKPRKLHLPTSGIQGKGERGTVVVMGNYTSPGSSAMLRLIVRSKPVFHASRCVSLYG